MYPFLMTSFKRKHSLLTLYRYLNSLYDFFESHVSIRMSMLLGLLISKSTPFIEFINYIFKPGVFGIIIKGIEYLFALLAILFSEVKMLFVMPFNAIKLLFILLFEVITPVLGFALELVKLKWSLVKLILYLPSISLVKLFLMLKEGFMGIVLIFKSIFSGLDILKRVIIPAAKTTYENKETTMSFIQICQNIGFAWSQSLYKKVI